MGMVKKMYPLGNCSATRARKRKVIQNKTSAGLQNKYIVAGKRYWKAKDRNLHNSPLQSAPGQIWCTYIWGELPLPVFKTKN